MEFADGLKGVKLVIPPSFLDELKSHPALSFKVSIDNVRMPFPSILFDIY